VKLDAAILRSVAGPFLSQDPQSALFAAICCNRIFVGPIAPSKCRTCSTVPRSVQITADSDLDTVAGDLSRP
jgi:hypothetical protein